MHAFEWNPARVIDNSTLTIAAKRTTPPTERSLAPDGGDSVGRLLLLEVLEVLDGEGPAEKQIAVFQTAGSVHGYQYISDDAFILFLRRSTDAEYKDIVSMKSDIRPKAIWVLAEPVEQWMSYYPLKRRKGAPGRTKLMIELSSVGVEESEKEAIAYFKALIQLRRRTNRGDAVQTPGLDKFQLQVVEHH